MGQTDSSQHVFPTWVTQFPDLRKPSIRDLARKITLDGLSLFDNCMGRTMHNTAPRVQFLLFHHVFDDEVSAFRKLLARLRLEFQFISYSEAVNRVLTGEIDQPYLAFSFDDGLKCTQNAADILEEFGATACFFACPAMINETNPQIIAQFCRQQLWHAPVDFLNWDDLNKLLDHGHEIGGHTINHINLADAIPAQVVDEVGQSYDAFVKNFGSVQHFAWPYGRFKHISKQAAEIIFQSGFHSCASAVKGSHTAINTTTNQDITQLCLYRASLIASWPISHILYFLRYSARQPLTIDQTWPEHLAPNPRCLSRNSTPTPLPCESPSTLSPSDQAAA